MVTRRQFLAGAAASGAVVVSGGINGVSPAAAQGRHHRLPPPGSSGLDHIVVVCMENRSFDHFLGWMPHADGRQAGLKYRDDAGVKHRTHHLDTYTGCGFHDPDHSYNGGRTQFADGRCDGFRRGRNDDFAIGYYNRRDVATMAQLADQYTVCDRWFSSILGPTYPNRFYTHSAATDRVRNTFTPSELPTIWDRFAAAHVPATYYYSDVPFLLLYGAKYSSIMRSADDFFADAAAGHLPSYSYLDPAFVGVKQNDDHPSNDIRRGQNFIGRVVKAVTESPQWKNTLLIVTYDEWGGFFDHVRPPRFPDDVENPGGDVDHPDHGQAGFRVPTFLVSPFARAGRVSHTTFEHSAILKLAEWRFGLQPLTRRDAASNNIARALDFRRPNLHPPALVVPPDPGPQECASSSSSPDLT